MLLVGDADIFTDPLGSPTLPLLVVVEFLCGKFFGDAWARSYPLNSLQCGQLVGLMSRLSDFLVPLLLVRYFLRYLGIKRLQQLVQQPPSEYASTDHDDESAMAATSESESSVEKRSIKQEDARKTIRDAVIGTAVEHHRHHQAVLHQDIAENIVQGEASAGNQTNRTSTRPTVNTAKS